jgi:predicted transposase YbfD/YdcC
VAAGGRGRRQDPARQRPPRSRAGPPAGSDGPHQLCRPGPDHVDHTTNEIARFRPLLDGLDLAGRVITADALHTHRDHADWLVTATHAAYVLIVKTNQPTLHCQLAALHCQLAALPWRDIPAQDHTCDRGHYRVEIRRLQVTTVAGLDFPHATRALRVTRRVRSLHGQRWRTVTVYAVTNLTAA